MRCPIRQNDSGTRTRTASKEIDFTQKIEVRHWTITHLWQAVLSKIIKPNDNNLSTNKRADKRSLNQGQLVSLLLFVLITAVQAKDSIPPTYLAIAQAHTIPPAVLYAIALVESGQKLASGQVRPWPWTLNVAGVPRRYPTRLAAWKGLKHYLAQGVDFIDVGIMQVNWHYHHKKLGTPWEALEPFNNTRTGAKILQAEYNKTGAWHTAIGRYHSPGQKPAQRLRAKHYAQRVMQQIKRIQR